MSVRPLLSWAMLARAVVQRGSTFAAAAACAVARGAASAAMVS
jgi:hypothetical protein